MGLPRLPEDRRLLQTLLTARLSHITTPPPPCVCLQHPSQTAFLAETFCNCSNTSGPAFLPPRGAPKASFPPTLGGRQRPVFLPPRGARGTKGRRWPGCGTQGLSGAGNHRRKGDRFLAHFPLLRSCLPVPQAAAENGDGPARVPFSLWVSPPRASGPNLLPHAGLGALLGVRGVGWLNLSRVEHPEANAWESSGWRGGYLASRSPAGLTAEQESAPLRAPSRARRPSPRVPGRSTALPLGSPLGLGVSLAAGPAVSSPLRGTCQSCLFPRIPQHLAALAAWEGWRTRVTSAPFSSLSSPPPFP